MPATFSGPVRCSVSGAAGGTTCTAGRTGTLNTSWPVTAARVHHGQVGRWEP